MGMANLRAGPTAGDDMATGVSGLFRTRYPEMVRLRTPTGRVFHYPAHVLEPTAGTMEAYLLDGRLVGVTGKVAGFWDSSSSSAIASRPASGSPAVVNMGGGIVNHAKLSEYYGYAHESRAPAVLLGYDAAGHVIWSGR